MGKSFEKKYPEKNDVVMTKIKCIDNLVINVELLEYGNIPGRIKLDYKNSKKILEKVKDRKTRVLKVLSVSEEDGTIELADLLGADKEEDPKFKACKDSYEKAKKVYSIMNHVSHVFNKDLDVLYKTIVWPLAEIYGHAFEAFQEIIQNENKVPQKSIIFYENLKKDIYDALIDGIYIKMKPKPIKVRVDVDIRCYGNNGVFVIQKAMLAAEKVSSEKVKVDMILESAPYYYLITKAPNETIGIEILEKALEACKKVIESAESGSFNIIKKPKNQSI